MDDVEAPGFISQLRQNTDFNAHFDQMFSIYLSNDGQSPSDITFGGYNLHKYAKKGKDLKWFDQSSNDNYWATVSKSVFFNDVTLSDYSQQVIFDNGMNHAMAPEQSFVQLIKGLHELGFHCREASPVWRCMGTQQKYESVPNLEFNLK